MTPLERVLEKLPTARKSGGGWTARCPAHDDNSPSLSVNRGDDGRILLHCHAGCRFADIVRALGLTPADLRPEKEAHRAKVPHMAVERGNGFSSAEAVIRCLARKSRPPSGRWEYHDAGGAMVGLTLRWDGPRGGKRYSPVALIDGRWQIAGMPSPRPLYRLTEVRKAKRVVVTEGEKAADAFRKLGFTATTSAGGADAVSRSDWTALVGLLGVWIFPDNDAPGRRYAEAVAAEIAKHSPATVVRVIELPGLPEKGDIVDWIDAHGEAAEPDGMRAELEAIAADVTPQRGGYAAAKPRSRAVLNLVCLADVEPTEVPWLWPSRIPLGRLTLLVGRPGAGKSFLTCDIAARLSVGAPWPDGGTAPLGSTLLISAEDDTADTIAPRLNSAGADLKRIHLLTAAKVVGEDGKERVVAFDLQNVDLIRDALDQLSDCKLVVIDPVGSYLGGRVDAHRDNEVRGVLAPLAALAAERGVAVLIVCHTRKAQSSFADDAALGSRAFVGLARCVLHLAADDKDRDRKLLVPGKSNLGEPAAGLAFTISGKPAHLEWEADPLDGLHADDLMAPPDGSRQVGGPKPRARDAAVDWLTRVLENSPLLVREIEAQAKAAGLAWRTVRRAREELAIIPHKQAFSGGWAWQLPNEGDHAHPRTGPRREAGGHLRENDAKNSDNRLQNVEGGQVQHNSAAFDESNTVSGIDVADGSLFPEARGLPD
ncbi:AAA family ATPase [Limnoglobus roseus]|uniref:DNA primase n=1 Tax=Limnoglobus roseus TaxID=2598579 RepID=A0A5C1AEN2_9BACT|nr:AAA family ATPase [Limnoglobus roseus]QEL16653.1 DNA primase [Limnoglobus roseus]